jgi:hypothetical protein
MPFRFSCDPPSDPASVDAFMKACPNPPGYHMRSPWDRLTAVSTYGPLGSEEDDEPDSGWDFSWLDNPSAMRVFMTKATILVCRRTVIPLGLRLALTSFGS